MITGDLMSKVDGTGRLPSASDLSRRGFLKAGAAAGGGLMLSFGLPLPGGAAPASGADAFAPNAFIRITTEGQIALTMPYVEMGQGTYTSIPMLIAEELEIDLSLVQLEHAPPDEKLYANPLLGVQATGNSNAIRAAWQPLRQAGAIARTMLVAAAAKRWNVDPAACRAQRGEVLHSSTGRRLTYGELAADAARMPVPEKAALLCHFVTARDIDAELMAKTKTPLSWATHSEFRLGRAGDPRVALLRMRKAGVTVSLSFDASSIAPPNMFETMRFTWNMGIPWRGTPSEALPEVTFREVIEMATLNGAKALGIGDVTGSITVGKRADIILIRGNDINIAPVADVEASVVQSATPANVDTVLVDGRIVKRGGKLVAYDVDKIVRDAKASALRIRTAAGGRLTPPASR